MPYFVLSNQTFLHTCCMVTWPSYQKPTELQNLSNQAHFLLFPPWYIICIPSDVLFYSEAHAMLCVDKPDFPECSMYGEPAKEVREAPEAKIAPPQMITDDPQHISENEVYQETQENLSDPQLLPENFAEAERYRITFEDNVIGGDLNVEPTQDFNVKPAQVFNVGPTQGFNPGPQDFNVGPTEGFNVRPTQNFNVDPTQLIGKPTPDGSVFEPEQ